MRNGNSRAPGARRPGRRSRPLEHHCHRRCLARHSARPFLAESSVAARSPITACALCYGSSRPSAAHWEQ
eukprot:6701102-Alexandrium_andersonii.AAC.1